MELTRIFDILKDADGAPAAGKLVIHNPAFIAADGTAVAAGILAYVIPTVSPGLVDLMLAPTEDADPAASYTVEYFLKSGAAYSETWQIPRTGPITISQARG
ncbi:MAG: hypothetical protein HY316_01805 [Acidobacteria bacterium]|nr:hypothetical protein [Acidobacteriota bacterium]